MEYGRVGCWPLCVGMTYSSTLRSVTRNSAIALGLGVFVSGCLVTVAVSGSGGSSASVRPASQPADTHVSETLLAAPNSGSGSTVQAVTVTVAGSDAPGSDGSVGSGSGSTTTVAAERGGSAPTSTVKAAASPSAGSNGSAPTSTVAAPKSTSPAPAATVPKVTAPPATQPPVTAPPATQPPATAPSTTVAPVRTIGSCQNVGVGPVNDWRAELGVAALSGSGSLYNGACAWATNLATTNTFTHGAGGEVLYKTSAGCSTAFAGWRGSAGHYSVLTTSLVSSIGVACVTDSNGTSWVVGRVA